MRDNRGRARPVRGRLATAPDSSHCVHACHGSCARSVTCLLITMLSNLYCAPILPEAEPIKSKVTILHRQQPYKFCGVSHVEFSRKWNPLLTPIIRSEDIMSDQPLTVVLHHVHLRFMFKKRLVRYV